MDILQQINAYIAAQPGPKSNDMLELHHLIMRLAPGCKLWFLDGKNDQGKTVSNPNIGYGLQTMKYAGGKTRDFYRIGLSANTTGISVYILGIEDKTYLSAKYGEKLGKASISGYCIKFKALRDINLQILEAALRERLEA